MAHYGTGQGSGACTKDDWQSEEGQDQHAETAVGVLDGTRIANGGDSPDSERQRDQERPRRPDYVASGDRSEREKDDPANALGARNGKSQCSVGKERRHGDETPYEAPPCAE